jgi:hypothetical protein
MVLTLIAVSGSDFLSDMNPVVVAKLLDSICETQILGKRPSLAPCHRFR